MTEKANAQLRAGVAKVEITTTDPREIINDPLYSRALVLDNGQTQIVIISMDVTAIGGIGDVQDDFLPKLRARLQDELAIEGSHVLVNATHTHPPGRLVVEDAEQVVRTFDAVKQALENMTPVKIGSGKGYEDRIMMNRNLKLKNGKHWTIRHANPSPPDDEVVGVGPIDPEIGIVRIDRLDGTPFAVLFNFAGHPIFADPRGKVTACYPGVACDLIEAELGGDVAALFLQGAGGDVIDVYFKDFGRQRSTTPLGEMLGLSTLEALRKIETEGDVQLNIISETIRLPRRTDSLERIEELRRHQVELLASLRGTSLNFKAFLPLYLQQMMSPKYPSNHVYAYMQQEKIGADLLVGMDALVRNRTDKYMSNIRAMEKLALIEDEIATYERHKEINDESGEDTIEAEVIGIKIGDCVFISAPIEILTEVSLNIKQASPYERTFMAAFSNGYMHYGPPAADYDKGGYEVVECLLAPEWQEIYEKTAGDIIRKL